MIISFSGVKYVLHGVLNRLNRQRFTRMSVSPALLINQMRNIHL